MAVKRAVGSCASPTKASLLDTLSSRLRLFTSISVALLVGLTSPVLAQDAGEENEIQFSVEDLSVGWAPGEKYNGLNGTMNYSHTDLYLPGNGKLPIEITRYFNQRRNGSKASPFGHFGHMAMAEPSIFFSYKNDTGETITQLCTKDGRASSTGVLKRPLTFTYGDIRQEFFSDGNNQPFRSKDNWQIQCVASTGTFGDSQAIHGSLIVKSPDGIQYHMKEVARGNVFAFLGGTAYRVDKITDPYNNSIAYSYTANFGDRYPLRLDSIVASDGRKVEIKYVKVRLRSLSDGEFYNINRVETIESTGSSNPIKLRYTYANDAQTLRVIENETATTEFRTNGGRLEYIKFPTNGEISYEYNQVISSGGTSYQTLSTRETSDGGEYNFSYADNGGDKITRTIKTPSAYLEMDYYKPKKPNQYGIVSDHRLESGRQVEQRRYVNNNGSRGELLLKTEYTFKLVSSVISEAIQSAELVVPKKTTYSMNFNGGGDPSSVFYRNNVVIDQYGYPTRISEKSADNQFTTTTISYKHSGFNRHIRGKVASIDASGDKTTYTYNNQGDVKSETVNGIWMGYEWYTGGASKGEMKKVTSATGNVTEYSDYLRGQARHIKNPSGFLQFRKVNDNGTIASETRFKENLAKWSQSEPATKYLYDSRRRLKNVQYPRWQSAKQLIQWDDNNKVTTRDSNYSRYRTEEYLDHFGRVVSKGTFDNQLNKWQSVKYLYDTEGRLLFQSYPVNVSAAATRWNNGLAGINYQYDALDRLVQVAQDEEVGNSTVTQYSYGSNSGNLKITQTDGRSNKVVTTYRSWGMPHYNWPIRISQADSTFTSISREKGTGRTQQINRSALTTVYKYNDKKLVESVTQPENGLTRFIYYPDGKLKERSNNGRSVFYEYYDDDRLKKTRFSDTSVPDVTREFRYDSYGNVSAEITTSSDNKQNNRIDYEYDDENNVKQQALTIDGKVLAVRFDYDELGGVERITYPSGHTYNFAPNSFGNPMLIREEGGAGKVIYSEIDYHHNNTVKLMRRNGHQVTTTLNRGQRPQKYRLQKYGNGSNQALGERGYFYDAAANVSRINDTVDKRYVTLQYDQRNRLTRESISNSDDFTYGYHSNDDIRWIQRGGKRFDFEYNNSSRQLTGVRSNSSHRRYEYDSHGNMTSHEGLMDESNKIRKALGWNAANQLVKSGNSTDYAYDARGLRVKKGGYGAVYTLYGPANQLLFRQDTGTGVYSEYFYIGRNLIARRDVENSSNDGNDGGGDGGNDGGKIGDYTVNGTVISWKVSGWHQVQKRPDMNEVCRSGKSCDVQEAGDYLVINHGNGTRTDIKISASNDGNDGGDGGDNNDGGKIGDYTVNGTVISWKVSGWHQVQKRPDMNEVCRSGKSCDVQEAGDYLVINHGNGSRTDIKISASNTNNPLGVSIEGKVIRWTTSDYVQVLRTPSYSEVCQGGQSCNVGTAGTYDVINLDTNVRQSIVVN